VIANSRQKPQAAGVAGRTKKNLEQAVQAKNAPYRAVTSCGFSDTGKPAKQP
jgi:hypothetical protein